LKQLYLFFLLAFFTATAWAGNPFPSPSGLLWNVDTVPHRSVSSLINVQNGTSIINRAAPCGILIDPTFPAFPNVCKGSAAPALPLTSSNGITGTWTPATINNLQSATYVFTPDANQCANNFSLTINIIEPPVTYPRQTNPTCSNNCNGNASVDVVGGLPPYSFAWSNGGTTQTITNLCIGTYTVAVTDANGCSSNAFTPVTASCFQIQSILVDGCSPNEWEEEMVFFQTGQTPINSSTLDVTWPTFTSSGGTVDPWNGLCQNPTFIANVNPTITGGGILIPIPAGGTIPANANVVLITTNTTTSSTTSFANLSDTLYVLFQCAGNSVGHFGNTAATIRTLMMSFGAGCTQSVNYIPNSLVGGNGAYVNYDVNGTPTYLNYGCNIPNSIQGNQAILTSPAPAVPRFDSIPPICRGTIPPSLQLPSINTPSITGTWSPAVINTTYA